MTGRQANLTGGRGGATVARSARRHLAWLTLLAFLALAPAASAAPLMPDLVADAPGASRQPEIYNDGGTQRLLLRMDGFVHNQGSGPLEIRGSSPTGSFMSTVLQRVSDSDTPGGFVDRPSAARLWFETADSHNHWHLMNAMRYSLWSADRAVEVAPAQKAGFCLVDSQKVDAHGPATDHYTVPGNNFCGQGQPTRPEIVMGVSPGWRDIYNARLPFQWVDISDTAPGAYWLRADADPDGVVQESDEVNVPAFATAPSIVNGYLAQPVDVGTVPGGRSTPIDLRALRYDDGYPGGPGAAQYSIVSGPSSGSLDRPAGAWFSGSRVNYTPAPGQSGPVSFTFAVRDSTSAFPRSPRTAGVTLNVAGPPAATSAPTLQPAPAALAISGAPAKVATSSVTRLTATGPAAKTGVTWSVNGAAGGSAKLGRISRDGVFKAPKAPPSGGRVTIGARSGSGASAKVVVRIVRAAKQKAAPSLTPPPASGRLSRIVLARQRRTLIAVAVPGRYGRLQFVARRDGERIGRCTMMAKAGVTATCSMQLSRKIAPDPFICKLPKTKGLKLPRVRVTATLAYGGGKRVVRRARTR
jgi:hypothetical protein